MAKKKKLKRFKIKWKVILKILLFLFLAFFFYYYLVNLETKSIVVHGTTLLSDYDVIMASGYKEYPKLFGTSKDDIEEAIKSLSLVDSVKIKRSIFGNLSIDIKEAVPLFYNRNNNQLVLDNKKEIDFELLNGVPVLINYVPSNYFDKLIEKMKNVRSDVRTLISEIEYQPWKSNDVMIDETRFFLRMNDGNSVYVNLIHLDKLNNYIEIFSSLEGKFGTLYLDSSSDKISFSEYKEEKKDEKLPSDHE